VGSLAQVAYSFHGNTEDSLIMGTYPPSLRIPARNDGTAVIYLTEKGGNAGFAHLRLPTGFFELAAGYGFEVEQCGQEQVPPLSSSLLSHTCAHCNRDEDL